MEKSSGRRRRVVSEESAGASATKLPLKAIGFGVLAVSVVCLVQFVLLSRHVDNYSHSASFHVGDPLWARLQAQDKHIDALEMKQKDLLRLTSELSGSLVAQQTELKQVEDRLISALSDSGASSVPLPRQQQGITLNMRQFAPQQPLQNVGVPQTSGSGLASLPSQVNAAQADVNVKPPAASSFSEGKHSFPKEWLARFSEKELLESAAEADKWRQGTRDAFLHAWQGYRKHAWGADEFNPTTGRSARTWANCGMQILDALSTMWVMGLTAEFDDATKWVEDHLVWNHRGMISFFETTIRALGGLVSAHSLSGRKIFLQKAKELADKMLPAFDRNTAFPWTQVDLQSGRGASGWYKGVVLAEAGTVQLEFRYLSQQTGDPVYAEKADASMRAAIQAGHNSGLVPWGLSRSRPPRPANNHITFGAMGDSYYEYLLKMWVQTDKTEPEWKDAWKKAMREMHERLILRTSGGLVYVAEENNHRIDHKMDHLACFVGGMLVYGARTLPGEEVDAKWEETAAGITETCFQMYHRQPSHLAAEASALRPDHESGRDLEVWNNAAHYLLRPEAAEAIFYMFYYTGDPKYRRMAGEIFEAIERNCKTSFGYSAVHDVRSEHPSKRNEMETFFLAETLKYLYLTFLPNPREVLSLDEFVFNTEAHPIRIRKRSQGFLAR
eukprot:TRINITY_DN26599_c0_g1_i1.p1 TRINITY_DN26599_c0_g1~~TRINITY_DN26599_c0_g1_i1.p1  ORF type:complete len:670 (+),score=97.09 TRINITY_DN26599_c0_g1_i1:177-2186(+)